ncbi:MAG: protein involved in polysaccharide export with SLBB domain [Patiriisocius sp.]|jgi:protein involved in polysaccharide export with SLBB domain
MRLKIFTLFIFAAMCSIQQVYSQNLNKSQLNTVNVDELSDKQVSNYWDKAKAEGYSLEQLEVILQSRGMSLHLISKLKQRITALRYTDTNTTLTPGTSAQNDMSVIDKFGFEGSLPKQITKSGLFGYDFFSNPNISFTPNLNLATPSTYELGPGDELLIVIWGAAENSYRNQVDREGAIRLKNIGPIYVSGLTIKDAKFKITSYLKRIYSGIGATNDSHNKVHVDISLVGVRTVQVNIIGEVKVPGTYSLSALSSVLNALYASGGPTENGTFRKVKVIRQGKSLGIFDIYKYLIEGSEEGNVLVRDQDKIIVSSFISRVQVQGNVKRPGLYELVEGETLEDFIGYFSGFTADAYKERLIVERVNGTQKEVREILVSDHPNFILKDGDVVTVQKIIDRFENRISIEGAVFRPGNYQLSEGLTLFDLLEKASGVKEDAFLERGIIYRTMDDVKQEIMPFSVKNVLNKSENIDLKREDKVRVFRESELKESKSISISGAINMPQTIQFIDKMSIEDFIAVSGGFREGADVKIIDIARRVSDGDFKTISKNIKRSTSDDLVLKENDIFYLEPFDRVSVRYMKGFTNQKSVTIKGEVSYPGNYTIVDKDERISDLVKKAGGFSPYAYLEGATLVRQISPGSEEEQFKLLKIIKEKDSLSNINLGINEFKIGIDLVKIMNSNEDESAGNLLLKEGDVLIIPCEKQTVEVRGGVLVPSLIRFDKSISLKEYIHKSGGFSENSKRSKAYVIYANGEVSSTKSFLFFKLYPKIKPGALIVVPNKIKRRRLPIQEVIAITTGVSTLGLLINALVK